MEILQFLSKKPSGPQKMIFYASHFLLGSLKNKSEL